MQQQSLRLDKVKVWAKDGRNTRTILDIPALNLAAGSLVAVKGASGAGKTTLLRLLSGLRLPDEGQVFWGNEALSTLSEQNRDAWRGSQIGFIFQDFRLFPSLSAVENVLLPATFHQRSISQETQGRAMALLVGMGLVNVRQRAASLSRGEQQRVAVARALLFNPSVILADEPTASLDITNAQAVTELLVDYARQHKTTLCVVSHDPAVLARMNLCFKLERGLVSEESSASACNDLSFIREAI